MLSLGTSRPTGKLSVPSSSPVSPLYCALVGEGNTGLPPTPGPCRPSLYSASGSEINVLIVLITTSPGECDLYTPTSNRDILTDTTVII